MNTCFQVYSSTFCLPQVPQDQLHVVALMMAVLVGRQMMQRSGL